MLFRAGDGTTTDRSTPVAVQAPEGVTLSGVSTGISHTCADGSDGKVYCWGHNGYVQLGNGKMSDSNTPGAVVELSGVRLSGVVAGGYHNCADGSDGKLYCWGFGAYGQLGKGDHYSTMRAVEVPAPEGVTLSGASAGALHTCAEGSDGKLYCWGANGGQLGDGTTTQRWTPVAVQAPEGVTLTGVTVGTLHTCALSTAGPAYCWGDNGYGQLGDGRAANSLLPVIVAATR